MIYFDNAATTINKPDSVIESMTYALRNYGNSHRGFYQNSIDASIVVHETRQLIAKLFNISSPLQVAFTYSATHSLNVAIKGLLKPDDHVITTIYEHNSVLRPLYELKEKGLELSFIKTSEDGTIQYEHIENLINERTKAIVVNHASNVTGHIIDLKRIGELTKKHGILLIVDASQSAGLLDIDVEDMNIDILCFTGHKSLYGPQGTGGIYIKEGITLMPLMSGGSGFDSFNTKQPTQMPGLIEAGTINAHGISGLNAGLKYILNQGINNICEYTSELTSYFFERIKDIKSVIIYGHTDNHTPVLSINIGDLHSNELAEWLYDNYKIAVRSGYHCAPLVHKHFKTNDQGMVRFSFSLMNTKEEIDVLIDAIKEVSTLYNEGSC